MSNHLWKPTIIATAAVLGLLTTNTHAQITFYDAVHTPSVESSWSLDSGDFNNDGYPDLALIGWQGDISIHLNDQTGSFLPMTLIPSGMAYGSGIVAADYNNDGWDDLACNGHDANSMTILINNQDGTFATPVVYPAGIRGWNVNAADLDNDGWVDVVSCDILVDTIQVFLNNQDGTFAPYVGYGVNSGSMDCALEDVNDDGIIDIIAAQYSWKNVDVLLGNGDGTFQPRDAYADGEGTRGVTVTDTDRDGDLDIVLANSYGGTVTIRKNDGSGQFPTKSRFSADDPWQIEAADMDLDGDPDLLMSTFFPYGVALFKNNGNGTFSSTNLIIMEADSGAYDICLDDFDLDGRIDIAVNSGQTNTLSIRLNSTAPLPVLSQTSLSRGQNTTLTVTGAITGETVNFVYSLNGAEPGGFCTPLLGGMCIDLVQPVLAGTDVADFSGTASITRTVPNNAPLTTVWTQAAIARGAGGSDSVKSNYLEDQITQ